MDTPKNDKDGLKNHYASTSVYNDNEPHNSRGLVRINFEDMYKLCEVLSSNQEKHIKFLTKSSLYHETQHTIQIDYMYEQDSIDGPYLCYLTYLGECDELLHKMEDQAEEAAMGMKLSYSLGYIDEYILNNRKRLKLA